MLARRILPLVVVLLPGANVALGQISPIRRFHYDRWRSIDYLAGELLYGVAQSRDGYLWIGGLRHLWRFDGVRFTPFMAGDSLIPGGRRRQSIAMPRFTDREGRLWISYQGGSLLSYDEHRLTLWNPKDTARINGPFALAQTPDGRIWANVEGRLHEWKDERYTPLTILGVPNTGVGELAVDSMGALLVGFLNGRLLSIRGGRVDTLLAAGPHGRVLGMLPRRDGKLWIHTEFALLLHDANRDLIASDSSFVGAVGTLAGDEKGGVWVAQQYRGLWHYDERARFIERISADELALHPIRGMYADRDGSLWLCGDNGLERLRPSAFRSASFSSAQIGGPESSVAWGDDGTLWAGGSNIAKIRLRIDTNPNIGPVVTTTMTAHALGSGSSLWVSSDGTNGTGGAWFTNNLLALHWTRGAVRTYAMPDTQQVQLPLDILHTRSGNVWALTASGPSRLVGDRFRFWKPSDPNFGRKLPRRWGAGELYEDPQGEVWARASDAVLRLTGDTITRFDRRKLGDWPAVLTWDGTGTTWVIGRGSSIIRIRGDRVAMALPPSDTAWGAISDVIDDGIGSLWISHADVIARVRIAELEAAADGIGPRPRVLRYGPDDGVIGSALLRGVRSIRRNSDSTLWFARDRALIIVDPRAVAQRPPPPSVLIEGIRVDDGPLSATGTSIVVPANGERVQFAFTSTTMRLPTRMRFRYLLEGVDRTWTEVTGLQRSALYPSLGPGTYRFRVQAADENGVWNEAGATLNVRKLARWYQTWWAAAFAAGTLVLGGAGASAARGRQRQRVTQLRHQSMMQERNRVARDMHDTLLQGFAAITLQLDQVRRRIVIEPTAAEASLAKLLDQADTTLASARRAVWALRAPELEEHGLVTALPAALERALADRCELHYATAGTARTLSPNIESAVFHIALEAAANAMMHGQPSRIDVSVSFDRDTVTLLVKDDGTGFDPEEPVRDGRPRLGLSGMRERAGQIGSDLEIFSRKGNGTTIKLKVSTSQTI